MTGLATSSGPTLLGKLRALQDRIATTGSPGDAWYRSTGRMELADLLPEIVAALEAKQ